MASAVVSKNVRSCSNGRMRTRLAGTLIIGKIRDYEHACRIFYTLLLTSKLTQDVINTTLNMTFFP